MINQARRRALYDRLSETTPFTQWNDERLQEWCLEVGITDPAAYGVDWHSAYDSWLERWVDERLALRTAINQAIGDPTITGDWKISTLPLSVTKVTERNGEPVLNFTWFK